MTELRTWTVIAVENGGVLHVVRERHLKKYTATMLWPQLPDSEPIDGEAATVNGALDELETALMEDAANEMAANPMSGV